MTSDTRQVDLPRRLHLRGAAASVGRFLWHLLQMVIAMEAGMAVYHLLLNTVLTGSSYAALTREYRLFGYWMMVVSMALSMLAFMRYYHKSNWRSCGAMTFAMLAPVAALTVLVLCELIPLQTLHAVGDPLMILAMAAYMLYRRGEHAHGGHEHADPQQAGSSDAATTKHTMPV
jgi:hypothetical protein